MARQILIVDAVATNRIVLKVKLTAAFYEVTQATNAAEALDHVRGTGPSLIMIGGIRDMSPVALCTKLRETEATQNCSIVMLATESCAEARLAVLNAGANSILEQPCCDALLLARLRALLRTHETEAEVQTREGTHRALGLSEPSAPFEVPGRIGVIAENRRSLTGRMSDLRAATPHRIALMSPRDVFYPEAGPEAKRPEAPSDVLILALTGANPEAELQIIPDLRARMASRDAGVLVLTPAGDGSAAATALNLGADDVAPADISTAEIALRADRLMARKRMSDRMRSTVQEGLRAAVTDSLTGLFNRRYALPHMSRIAERAARLGRPFAVMVADLDHFKRVNDRYGHAAGDAVLAEVAQRLRCNLRAVDLVARIGGEEFLMVLPDASDLKADRMAHRLCAAISDHPFAIPDRDDPIHVTISIGVTIAQFAQNLAGFSPPDTLPPELRPTTLLRRADTALYEAKAQGRNQVELSRPAA